MLETKPIPPGIFRIEGTLLECSGKSLDKSKFIVLEVEQEAIPIKLPKQLRDLRRQHLQPGDHIKCIGRSQIDFDAGVIRLEAYGLFPLSPDAEDTPVATVPIASSTLSSQPHTTWVQPPPRSPKRAKVLFCKKSGCQKRGGRQLVVGLERILQQFQLQDQVDIAYSGCQKRCSKAPSLTIMPGRHYYDRLTLKKLTDIIQKHFCMPKKT